MGMQPGLLFIGVTKTYAGNPAYPSPLRTNGFSGIGNPSGPPEGERV
jgi:hypothetical protein